MPNILEMGVGRGGWVGRRGGSDLLGCVPG